MSTPTTRLSQISSHLSPSSPSLSPRLLNKVCILTGCNSPLGIGLATATLFAQHSPRALILCDFSSSHLEAHVATLKELAEKSNKQWAKLLGDGQGSGEETRTDVISRTFDASEEAGVKAVCEEAVALYGRLDVFFANAGIVGTPKKFLDVEVAEFERTFRVNTTSVFLALKHATPLMCLTTPSKPHPSGSFIATASTAALRSGAGPSDYSASKAAVVNLIQTAAFQLSGSGVRCNAICPGLIETGMTRVVYEKARERGTEGKIGGINPMQRGGRAEEVARVVLSVAEEGYGNAQAVVVDGGLSGSLPVVRGSMW